MAKRNPLAEDNEYLRKRIEEMSRRLTWELTDHLCVECSGRILKSATGNGMSPGGNPTFRCADCGKRDWGLSASSVCWCGMTYRNQSDTPYMCRAFKEIDKCPELLEAFRSCGCEPPPPWGTNTRGGDVGVISTSTLRQLRTSKGLSK